MNRLKIASILLSVSCLSGVLMAAIVTGNEAPKSVRTASSPIKSPKAVPAKRPTIVAAKTPVQEEFIDAPDGIDRMITAAISRAEEIQTDIRKPVPRPSKPVASGSQTITVQSGDTLFAIARRTGVNVHKLAAINSLEAPFVIRPGQILSTQVQ